MGEEAVGAPLGVEYLDIRLEAVTNTFEFGRNWRSFLEHLNETRIATAGSSLAEMLEIGQFDNKRFLDVGSGSGLFSLAARRRGARVHSFDADPISVECTQALRDKYFPGDPDWVVHHGSILDEAYVRSLGRFDAVYSWGVLHHTGAMWKALGQVRTLVGPRGLLYIAIYNDQGAISAYWKMVKRAYNRNSPSRGLMIVLHLPYLFARLGWRAIRGDISLERGMSLWHDFRDWLGGYPFEVAKPEEIIGFFESEGFILRKAKTCGRRHGCNEFVFERTGDS
jgi:2-polyprenyl-3-methyl-5-hydroxy-6-metoxy-1,4-benzoquinol methylase